jgi:hypothetical protein
MLSLVDLTLFDKGMITLTENYTESSDVSKAHLATIQKNLASLGFSLDLGVYFLGKIIPAEKELGLDFIGTEFCNKEIKANVYAMYMDYHKKFVSLEGFTATDILRVIVATHGYSTYDSDFVGDVSLKEPCVFKGISRKFRRYYLEELNNINYVNLLEDMIRYKERWIRLGEVLHPSEYSKKYSNVYKAFSTLRNDSLKLITFNSKFNFYIENGKLNELLEIVCKRPGEFARRLDYILRTFSKDDELNKILISFAGVAEDVSSTVLLQVSEHFANRLKSDIRTFLPKGKVGKLYAVENKVKPIKEDICKVVQGICFKSLVSKMCEKPSLGKCYVSESLKDYKVPFALRSSNKSKKTYVRGSRIKFNSDKNTIRLFIYWENKNGETIDVDLSAVGYNEKWENVLNVGFYNLRGDCCIHSGDIVDAPKGASEFIDVDIDRMLKETDVRYLTMNIHSYTHNTFDDFVCKAGWMYREEPNSGEIYEPKTVEHAVDLVSRSDNCVPVIFDIVKREFIWTDLEMGEFKLNTAFNSDNKVALIGYAMDNLVKPNLYDLFKINAVARGEMVDNKGEADIVFDIDGDITPLDIETILAEYM